MRKPHLLPAGLLLLAACQHAEPAPDDHTVKIAGTYDCRVYQAVDYYAGTNGQSSVTRLPDAVLAVAATGPQTLTIGTYAGVYDPTASAIMTPNGPNTQFRVDVAERSLAHFYTTGDSLLYTQWSHVGHQYTTTRYYRGRRRP